MVLLLNKRTLTAKELADRFQVSTRTIYRDIEILSASGIPVYMTQGAGGGISLLEEYCVNRTCLSVEERENLMLALQSLQSTSCVEVKPAMEKLRSIFKKQNEQNWVQVDLSSWGPTSITKDNFDLLRQAILDRRLLRFNYVNTMGQKGERLIEPLQLLYKGQAWYLYGYCRLKHAIRLFKVSRIKQPVLQEETFPKRGLEEVREEKTEIDSSYSIHLKLKFKPSSLYRVYDTFEEEEIFLTEQGEYEVNTCFPEGEWIESFILSFGNEVQVLEPEWLKERIKQKLLQTLQQYE